MWCVFVCVSIFSIPASVTYSVHVHISGMHVCYAFRASSLYKKMHCRVHAAEETRRFFFLLLYYEKQIRQSMTESRERRESMRFALPSSPALRALQLSRENFRQSRFFSSTTTSKFVWFRASFFCLVISCAYKFFTPIEIALPSSLLHAVDGYEVTTYPIGKSPRRLVF